ncbi:hypothetical protein FOA52_003549 [Chlamydomonas sp. UWO 241]|nr:hypothetical protein FOA52_003549 [Chlamydomonas sp. UWO 241]
MLRRSGAQALTSASSSAALQCLLARLGGWEGLVEASTATTRRRHGGVASLFETHGFDKATKDAPEKFKKEARSRLAGIRQLPWEVAMTPADAAKHLGSFLGAQAVEPAAVLDLTREQVHAILDATTNKGDAQLDKALFSHADAVTERFFGDEIYYRGIVEFSNVCTNDCNYCGIRKHAGGVTRYTMPIDEVAEVSRWAFENHMSNVMLQSGELPTAKRLEYLVEVVRRIRSDTVAMDREKRGAEVASTPDAELGMAVSLSVGELPRSDYEALFAAGARRYLLRIETSNPELYSALHPGDMSWAKRVQCLQDLKDVGFMIGTGVMVGLPGQTLHDLAGDIRFFKDINAHMIGMGPYITEEGTPTAAAWGKQFGDVDKKNHMKGMFDLTTRMNALARIVTGNANISATTALQAIDPMGREIALRRGSNVLMPILTPTKYRINYQLYEGKPCITDTAEECRRCLNARISMIGKRVSDGVWGDPKNFLHPIVGQRVGGGGGGAGAGAASVGAGAVAGGEQRSYHSAPAGAASSASGGGSTGRAPRAPPPLLVSSPGVGPILPLPGVHAHRAYTSASASQQRQQQQQQEQQQRQRKFSSAPAPRSLSPSTDAGSDVQRVNIGVFGVMNAGKSTAINAITQQETSIVDATPGTTADVKVALMELHDVGPAKLFDTAGIDEAGVLGDKKRAKTLSTIKECDVAMLVLDAPRLLPLAQRDSDKAALRDALRWELTLMQAAEKHGVSPLLLLNAKGGMTGDPRAHGRIRDLLDPTGIAGWIALNLNAREVMAGLDIPTAVSCFLQAGVAAAKAHAADARSLPDAVLSPDAMVFLNIPMDAETPTMRLLRPQALVQEEAIRHWATTTAYRMNLSAARSGDPEIVAAERARFDRAMKPLLEHPGPKVLVTDSQAIDIVHPWTQHPSGAPTVPITTFSICMVQRQSGGRLPMFADGLRALTTLRKGDKVLIAEACNHNRITATCNDIGMVQIPHKIAAACGPGVQVQHAFGREYPDMSDGSLGSFKLAIHCGGCMIDRQKMRARISDMEDAGVPVTNYGLFLAHVHAPAALEQEGFVEAVLEMFGHLAGSNLRHLFFPSVLAVREEG